jgi:curved DNA-binding protein CbpA
MKNVFLKVNGLVNESCIINIRNGNNVIYSIEYDENTRNIMLCHPEEFHELKSDTHVTKMTIKDSLFDLLDILPNSSFKLAKKQYRKKLLYYHPDHHKKDDLYSEINSEYCRIFINLRKLGETHLDNEYSYLKYLRDLNCYFEILGLNSLLFTSSSINNKECDILIDDAYDNIKKDYSLKDVQSIQLIDKVYKLLKNPKERRQILKKSNLKEQVTTNIIQICKNISIKELTTYLENTFKNPSFESCQIHFPIHKIQKLAERNFIISKSVYTATFDHLKEYYELKELLQNNVGYNENTQSLRQTSKRIYKQNMQFLTDIIDKASFEMDGQGVNFASKYLILVKHAYEYISSVSGLEKDTDYKYIDFNSLECKNTYCKNVNLLLEA